MRVYKYPVVQELQQLLQRPANSQEQLYATVKEIAMNIKANGDSALLDYCRRFDGLTGNSITLDRETWDAKAGTISPELQTAINTAAKNIDTFHRACSNDGSPVVTTMPGVQCWRKSIAIDTVGIYIPGGTAPLFSSLLMAAIPAKIAGCKNVIVCTPAASPADIHPAILYAAKLTGITAVYAVGGAQAIAAMAFGTETIPKVQKIFGPGNRYVMAAKLLVQSMGVAIDLPAGPSEVAILADDSCEPAFVAADLLAQAEHGADSQVLLVTDSIAVTDAVNAELEKQLALLPRKDIAAAALQNSVAIITTSLQQGMNIINSYAPEHLIIASKEADVLANMVVNAGSVFLGNYTPESAGDYASGTNHTLPTNGYAAAYSGVSVDSFVKKVTFQSISPEGLNALGNTIETMAMAEGLDAHAASVSVRLKKINEQ